MCFGEGRDGSRLGSAGTARPPHSIRAGFFKSANLGFPMSFCLQKTHVIEPTYIIF